MGKIFGELYKIRGIVYYRLSPFELKAFHGAISKGFGRTLRRIFENVPYAGPREYFILITVKDNVKSTSKYLNNVFLLHLVHI